MGEVYRARDPKLSRDIALKILPDAFAHDADRLARFAREARVLASLNHTHIAAIYGLEESTGVRALVMEYVEGPTLADRIALGPIPLDEAIPIAKQIAAALEAAHEQGIVHRDLKPANVKVRSDGTVKVLDFGLARAFDPMSASGVNQMNSPTITSPATQLGVILGTAAYMAPEQARGRVVDKRADIWAFGCVLFEMLTGQRLFAGDDVSDTLAAVLREPLDWKAVPAGTPGDVTRLLRRCVERDLKHRLHDIADVRIALEEIERDPAAPAAVTPSRRRHAVAWLAAGVAVAAALLAGLALGRWTGATDSSSTRLVRLVVPAPPGVTDIGAPGLSRDGSTVAFNGSAGGKLQIYVHRFSELTPRPLPGTDGAIAPFLSPDGKWVVFRRSGRLDRMAVDGGDPITIANLPEEGPSGTWGPDGTIVIPAKWYAGLVAVPSSGGMPRPLTTLDTARNEKGHWFPQFLPDGRHVIFTVWYAASGLNDANIAVVDLETGTHQVLFPGACAFYVPGALVFYRAGAYQAIRFDPDTLKTSGEPFRVLDEARGIPPDGGASSLVASPTGMAAYIPGRLFPETTFAWVMPDGSLDPLPYPARSHFVVRTAPDGNRAAVAVLDAGRWVLHLLDLNRKTDDPLDLPGSNWMPSWHPDGRHLTFRSMLKGTYDISWKDVSTSDPPTALLATERDETPAGWLPDGRTLAMTQEDADGQYRLKLFTPGNPAGGQTLAERGSALTLVSPNGRWLAFIDNPNGRNELFVQALTGKAAAQRISTNNADVVGGWFGGKNELLYLRGQDIVAVTYHEEDGQFRVDAERTWAHVSRLTARSGLHVTRDGRVLVLLPTEQPAPQLRAVLGWDQELARRFER
jgi:serine/threonine-protein kinase